MSDYSHSNPAMLLCRTQHDGDLNAPLELYRSYVKLLARAQIGKGLAGKVDASDIVQEVFLQASRAFPQFRGTTEPEFLAWLRQILASVLANQVRRYHGTKQRDMRTATSCRRFQHHPNRARR
jgi:RNA polymerase sigma-70 factor (ECF subfamily)